MTTITQDITDIAGVDDNTSWTFYTQEIRLSDSGDAIISTKKVRKYPVAGVLTVELDPGPAVVLAADGKTYPFTVPETDSQLWTLIQAAVTIPPSTRHQELLDAVDAWLEVNANAWDSIPGKPAVIAAGATAAAARRAIGAADEATAGAMRSLMSKLTRNVSDAVWVSVSDSTGNDTTEWVYLTAQWLASTFPAYTVTYRLWDTVGDTDYAPPVTIQTGTGTGNSGGPYTLSIYNAAVAGTTTGYFQGTRFTAAIANKDADLLTISHGHNQGGPVNTENTIQGQRNKYVGFAIEAAAVNPRAGVVLILQNPEVDGVFSHDGKWQAQRANLYAQIASWYGWGVIDVLQAFVDYGDWATDLTNVDGVHPTTAGSLLWASLVEAALERAQKTPVTTQPPIAVRPSQQLFKNPMLSAWSDTLPDGVSSTTNCTVSKELTDYETGSQAMLITATSTSGQAYVEITGTADAWGIKGMLANRTYTAMVRIKVPASNTQTVRCSLLDNNGGTFIVNTDVEASARDRYVWIPVTKNFPSTATTLTLRIGPKTSGTSTVTCLVDRILLMPGPVAHTGFDRDTIGQIAAADGSFLKKVSGSWTARSVAQVQSDLSVPVVTQVAAESNLPRENIQSGVYVSNTTQIALFGYFTAKQDITISNLTVVTGSTAAAATPTTVKFGVYSVDPSTGDLTLLRATANDTTLLAATFTSYTKALSSSVDLVTGTRYAYAVLQVSSAAVATLAGISYPGMQTEFFRAPRLSAIRTGQTDLTSYTDASMGSKNGIPYIVGT